MTFEIILCILVVSLEYLNLYVENTGDSYC